MIKSVKSSQEMNVCEDLDMTVLILSVKSSTLIFLWDRQFIHNCPLDETSGKQVFDWIDSNDHEATERISDALSVIRHRFAMSWFRRKLYFSYRKYISRTFGPGWSKENVTGVEVQVIAF